MVITTRDDIAERVGKQRAFGIDKSVLADRRHTGAYDIEHVGLNYRLGEVGAAMGVVQLRAPARASSTHRARIYGALWDGLSRDRRARADRLARRRAPARRATTACRRARATPLHERREAVIEALKAAGVGTSVYYPKSLPDTAYYARRYGYAPGTLPERDAHQLRVDRASRSARTSPRGRRRADRRDREGDPSADVRALTGRRIALIGGAGFIGHNMALRHEGARARTSR